MNVRETRLASLLAHIMILASAFWLLPYPLRWDSANSRNSRQQISLKIPLSCCNIRENCNQPYISAQVDQLIPLLQMDSHLRATRSLPLHGAHFPERKWDVRAVATVDNRAGTSDICSLPYHSRFACSFFFCISTMGVSSWKKQQNSLEIPILKEERPYVTSSRQESETEKHCDN